MTPLYRATYFVNANRFYSAEKTQGNLLLGESHAGTDEKRSSLLPSFLSWILFNHQLFVSRLPTPPSLFFHLFFFLTVTSFRNLVYHRIFHRYLLLTVLSLIYYPRSLCHTRVLFRLIIHMDVWIGRNITALILATFSVDKYTYKCVSVFIQRWPKVSSTAWDFRDCTKSWISRCRKIARQFKTRAIKADRFSSTFFLVLNFSRFSFSTRWVIFKIAMELNPVKYFWGWGTDFVVGRA